MKAATDTLSIAIRAVADPSRRKILTLLSKKNEVIASDVEERIKLAQSTTSHHMKVLAEARLIVTRKEGTCVWYRRNEQAIKQLIGEIREL